MTWAPSGLTEVVRDVPPVQSARVDLIDFLFGLRTAPTIGPRPDRRHLEQDVAWFSIDSTTAFWEGGRPDALTRAVTEFLAGAWAAESCVRLVAHGSPTGLRVALGVSGPLASSAKHAIAAALPSAGITRLLPHAATHADLQAVVDTVVDSGKLPAIATAGLPAEAPAPLNAPLLQRLAESGLVGWTLLVEVYPVPLPYLVDRHDRLAHLAEELGQQPDLHLDLTDTRRGVARDLLRDRLWSALEAELDLQLDAMARGGAVVTCSLHAADPHVLAAGAGILGASVAAGEEPAASRPCRVVPIAHPDALPATFMGVGGAAQLLQPPAVDVRGLPCREHARFDQHPEAVLAGNGGRLLGLGTAIPRGAALRFPADVLTSHLAVFGQPGTGKSSFLLWLLDQVHREGVATLVIEPSKDEYRRALPPGTKVWRIGDPAFTDGVRVNPLEVPAGVAISTHLDRLVALFRSSFSLISPLPFILEDGFHEVYRRAGWDVATDGRIGTGHSRWPTISELIETCCDLVDGSDYDDEVRRNVKGALRTRLGTLTRGPRGVVLDTDEASTFGDLLTGSALVNLDAVGDDEVKAFFVGLVVLLVAGTRQGHVRPDLAHLLVIEEAHRVFGRDEGKADAESADAGGHTTRSLADLLAEARASGQGVVVVEQSPSRLNPVAIANSAVKVAFRTVEGNDKECLAAALNLDEPQRRALTALGRNEAAVFWPGMDRPMRATMAALPPPPHIPAALTRARSATSPPPSEAAIAIAAEVVVTPADRSEGARSRLLRAAGSRAVALAAVEHRLRDPARARGWPPGLLRRATEAAVDGATIDHPHDLLLDGRQPMMGCRAVCPGSGCLVGELAAPVALRIRSDRSTSAARLAVDVTERAPLLERGAMDVLGPSAEPDLLGLARGCIAVHLLDSRVSWSRLQELVDATERELAALDG